MKRPLLSLFLHWFALLYGERYYLHLCESCSYSEAKYYAIKNHHICVVSHLIPIKK